MSSPARPPDDLTSWKAISEHLGVNVRTAQKWEREWGLPVRRSPGEKGRVSALSVELDAWRAGQAGRRSHWWASLRFLRVYSVVATVAVLALAGAFALGTFLGRKTGRPISFHAEHRTLTVADNDGRPVWRHVFDVPLAPEAYAGVVGQQRVWFGDLDGDGGTETLFVLFPADSVTKGTTLICFGQDGRQRWSYTPDVIADGRREYPATYIVSSFAIVQFGDGTRPGVAVTCRHTRYHPNHFAILDASGARRADYWHSGHLDYMEFADLDGDGVKEVLLSGVRNSLRAATLVVLDPRRARGAVREEAGSEYQIRGQPAADEKAILLFPRTCVSRLFDLYNMGKLITVEQGRITVWVAERIGDESQAAIHTLDFHLRSLGVQLSDPLRAAHRMLEVERKLDHTLTDAEIERLKEVTCLRRQVAP